MPVSLRERMENAAYLALPVCALTAGIEVERSNSNSSGSLLSLMRGSSLAGAVVSTPRTPATPGMLSSSRAASIAAAPLSAPTAELGVVRTRKPSSGANKGECMLLCTLRYQPHPEPHA